MPGLDFYIKSLPFTENFISQINTFATLSNPIIAAQHEWKIFVWKAYHVFFLKEFWAIRGEEISF